MIRQKTLLLTITIFLVSILGFAAYGIKVIDADTDVIRIACVGDSITKGSDYPDKLQEMLGENYAVGNFGVDGSTISQETKTPYMYQDEFIKALEFQPNIVIVMLGTNDANSEINYNKDNSLIEDYAKLVNSFRALEGDQQILLVKSPPIMATNSPYNNSFLVNTILPQIDSLAQKLNVPTVDVYKAIGENPDYFFDGIHPDDDGANIIASTLYNHLT